MPAATGIASTYALTAALSSIPGLADGGPVTGPGGPRSDVIPRMLTNGEFVVNAKSAARFRPLLEQINKPTAMNNGGFVNSEMPSSRASGDSQRPQKTEGGIRIINSLDPSIVEDFLNSSNGDKIFINKIERNASSIKQMLRNA